MAKSALKFAKARAARAKGRSKARLSRIMNMRKKSKPRLLRNVNTGLGFPRTMKMTHKYSEIVTLQSIGGNLQVNRFSCNSMYDPNVTGGGHQPLYFDQMAALYNHYVVIACKYTLKFVPTAANQAAMRLACFVNDDTTSTANPDTLAEQSDSSNWHLVPAGNGQPYKITRKWSAKKVFGGSILGNPNLQGTSAGAPSEQSFMDVYINSCDGATTVSCYMQYQVEFIAVWRELKDIGGS